MVARRDVELEEFILNGIGSSEVAVTAPDHSQISDHEALSILQQVNDRNQALEKENEMLGYEVGGTMTPATTGSTLKILQLSAAKARKARRTSLQAKGAIPGKYNSLPSQREPSLTTDILERVSSPTL